MIIAMSIAIISLLMVFCYFLYKDVRHPGFIFLSVWFCVCAINAGFINYIEISSESYIYIVTMLFSFSLGTLFFRKKNCVSQQGYLNERGFKFLFVFSLCIQILAVLILLFEAQRFSGGIVKYVGYLRSVQMFPDEATYPGLLGNQMIMRIIKNNYLVNYFLLLILALKTQGIKKWVVICLVARLMYAGMMGSRWQGVMDILSLTFIYLDRHKYLIKPIMKYSILFFIFFMLAGTIRSTNGFGLEYLVMYVFGGFPAFSELLKNPDALYLPNTAIYAEQLLGIASDNAINIVADSIWLNDTIKTNTFTAFGVMYKYYGEIGSIVYFFAYGALLNFLYYRKYEGVLYPVLYYIIAPTVLLTVFTESMLGLLPIIIRLLFVLFLLKLVVRVKQNA